MHTSVHLKRDIQRISGSRGSRVADNYLLAHRALMHFSLGGALSLFGPAIGCYALLNSSTSESVIRILALLVEKKGEVDQSILEKLPKFNIGKIPNSTLAESIIVEAFSIHDGSCVVVKVPHPNDFAEAYFVAIVIGINLETGDILKTPQENVPLLYFTLEKTDSYNGVERTIVGEWKIDGSRRNYGIGPNPNVREFVEVLEKFGFPEFGNRLLIFRIYDKFERESVNSFL